jgi:hypothetical protein
MRFVIHIVPEIPVDESRRSKVNPKRQKLAELAASLKSSDKRSERARKRKERENTSSKKDKQRKKRKTVDGDDASRNNRLVYCTFDCLKLHEFFIYDHMSCGDSPVIFIRPTIVITTPELPALTLVWFSSRGSVCVS